MLKREYEKRDETNSMIESSASFYASASKQRQEVTRARASDLSNGVPIVHHHLYQQMMSLFLEMEGVKSFAFAVVLLSIPLLCRPVILHGGWP